MTLAELTMLAIVPHPWLSIGAGLLAALSWGERRVYVQWYISIGCLNNREVMGSCWGDQAS